MKRVFALRLTFVFVIGFAVLIISSCHVRHSGFSDADILSIIVVDTVPDDFILLSEAIHLISEKDEHVEFYIWKNSVGIIDWSRRNGSERNEYAFDTSVQDTEFIVSLKDGSVYVNWQTFLEFLNMLEIQIEPE